LCPNPDPIDSQLVGNLCKTRPSRIRYNPCPLSIQLRAYPHFLLALSIPYPLPIKYAIWGDFFEM
jgi:hypothetical protein